MAQRLRIDKKYYLLDNEVAGYQMNPEDDPNLKKLPFDEIDFSPLYRNLHMNQVLVSFCFVHFKNLKAY